MPINYSNTIKNARLEVVRAALASGGEIVIGTAALAGAVGILVRIPLSTTVGVISDGVLTLNALPRTGTATASGTAALAELRNASNVVVASGLTVGTAPGNNITINADAISTGQTVQVSAGVVTHG
jgi:hypothetical protein